MHFYEIVVNISKKWKPRKIFYLSKPLLEKMVVVSDVVYEFSVCGEKFVFSVDRTFVSVVSTIDEIDDCSRKSSVEFRKTDE